MVDFNNLLSRIGTKIGDKVSNSEKLSEMAGNMGTKFCEKVQSGNFAEGSIFDAAQKLGINNKDDLKDIFAKFKENPKETLGDAFTKLNDQGFFKDYYAQADNPNAANQGAQQGTQGTANAGQQTEDAGPKATNGTNKTNASQPNQPKTTQYDDAKLKKAYRAASRMLHPDMGGSKEAMQELNNLKAEASQSDANMEKYVSFLKNLGLEV